MLSKQRSNKWFDDSQHHRPRPPYPLSWFSVTMAAPPEVPGVADPKVGAGILIRTLKKGDESRRLKNGNTVLVHYEGFLEDGTKFESSRDRNQPLSLKLGQFHVMEGWEVALANMHVGQEAEVTIPHLYAYGEQGYPPKIPPRSTLIFRMQILEILSIK